MKVELFVLSQIGNQVVRQALLLKHFKEDKGKLTMASRTTAYQKKIDEEDFKNTTGMYLKKEMNLANIDVNKFTAVELLVIIEYIDENKIDDKVLKLLCSQDSEVRKLGIEIIKKESWEKD